MLCECGQTAILEDHFLNVVEKLLPTIDSADRRRLLLLLPKSPEGRIDVPEVLSQLVSGCTNEQTMTVVGRGLPTQQSPPRAGGTQKLPGPDLQPPVSTTLPQ